MLRKTPGIQHEPTLIFSHALTRVLGNDKRLTVELPATLPGRNLLKTTDPFSKQAKEGGLHLMEAFDQVVHVILSRHTDAVHAVQELEDPTQGWP